jgi:hypothetical protein
MKYKKKMKSGMYWTFFGVQKFHDIKNIPSRNEMTRKSNLECIGFSLVQKFHDININKEEPFPPQPPP